jgi:hypothetical protein
LHPSVEYRAMVMGLRLVTDEANAGWIEVAGSKQLVERKHD